LTIQLQNSAHAVPQAAVALEEFWDRHQLPFESLNEVQLAVEEVIANVIRHACRGREGAYIALHAELAPGEFVATVEDDGAPFDPLSHPEANAAAGLEERRAGGMGLLLVRRLMDSVAYEYRGGRNRFQMRKHLAASA
jgi:serine/threonine-protein kinase RsbW